MQLPGPRRRHLWLLALWLAGCGGVAIDDLADGMLALPRPLREVSGIVAVDAHTLACVQDEAGALYFVDVRGRESVRRAAFGERGDYEGLACAGDELWVLRSDGLLLRLRAHEATLEVASTCRLPTEHNDWEGLCWDEKARRLLVLPKDRAGSTTRERDQRPIFAVDPATGAVLPEPALVLSRRAMIEQARERGIVLPGRTTAKGKREVVLRLLPSELLVIPASDELLVLSAVDHALLRVDRDGRLLGCQELDAAALPQPEAMAFLPDGRLVVASEGAGGPAALRVVPLR